MQSIKITLFTLTLLINLTPFICHSMEQNDLDKALLKACKKEDNINQIKHLLKAKAAVNAKSDDHFEHTPLLYATIRNNFDIIQLLINNKADVNQPDNVSGYTPLNYAVSYANAKAVQLLIKHKANVNQPNKHGETPLYFAIGYNNTEAMQLLIKHDANVNQPNNLCAYSPLHKAAGNFFDATKILLEHGAIVDDRSINIAKDTDKRKIRSMLKQVQEAQSAQHESIKVVSVLRLFSTFTFNKSFQPLKSYLPID